MNLTSLPESLPKTSLQPTVILHLIAHFISQTQTRFHPTLGSHDRQSLPSGCEDPRVENWNK